MSKSENSLIQPFSDFDTTLFYAHLIVHVLHDPSTVLCECKSIVHVLHNPSTVLCKCKSNSELHYHCGPRDSGSINIPQSMIWSNTTIAVCKGYATARLYCSIVTLCHYSCRGVILHGPNKRRQSIFALALFLCALQYQAIALVTISLLLKHHLVV